MYCKRRRIKKAKGASTSPSRQSLATVRTVTACDANTITGRALPAGGGSFGNRGAPVACRTHAYPMVWLVYKVGLLVRRVPYPIGNVDHAMLRSRRTSSQCHSAQGYHAQWSFAASAAFSLYPGSASATTSAWLQLYGDVGYINRGQPLPGARESHIGSKNDPRQGHRRRCACARWLSHGYRSYASSART